MNKISYCLWALSVILSVSAAVADSAMSIVVPCKPHTNEQFAARELKYHIEKATGKTVKILSEDATPKSGRRLFVGNVKALSAIGVDYDAFEAEERMVCGVGGDVYLSGGEMKEDIADIYKFTDAGTKRGLSDVRRMDWCGLAGGGTLYAVYDFLEKEMGVLWLWPGELGEIIPKREVPCIDGVKRKGREPLLQRYLWHDFEKSKAVRNGNTLFGWSSMENATRHNDKVRLWKTRNRVGLRHIFNTGHAFTEWYGRFGKRHPEYLAMQPSGRRNGYPDGKKNIYYPICVANPEVHDVIVAGWLKRNGSRLEKGLPPLPINCCENDSPGFCVCPKCRAWDADDPGFKTNPYWNGTIKEVTSRTRGIMAKEQWGEDGELVVGKPPSLTDRYVKFYNAVLAKARKIHPLAEVNGYAYSNYRMPPVETRLSDGVVISFVPGIIFPYSKEKSDEFRKDWGSWNRMGAAKMVYRPNYMHGGGIMPYSQARMMAADINFAYARGLIAISQDSLLGAWSAQAMKNYVAARILREPDATYGKMSKEFYSAFGAARDDVCRYFEKLEALNDRFTADEWAKIGDRNREKSGAIGGKWNNFVLCIADLYSEEWFASADEILVGAAKKVEGSERERVEFLRKGLHNGLLTYRTRVAQKSGDDVAFKEAFKRLIEYRASIENDGVCAWASGTKREYSYAKWPHVLRKCRPDSKAK